MPKSRSKLILIVEDDDTLRLLVGKQLSKLGFIAESASDGKQAVEKAMLKTFDLILMDVQMPKMDGFEATSAIREFEFKNDRKRSPIIAVTANPDKAKCMEHGMDDFIFKPVMMDQLEAILNRWIDQANDLAAVTRETSSISSEPGSGNI